MSWFLFYCYDKTPENKSNLGRWYLCQFIIYGPSLSKVKAGTQSRILESGAEAQDLEKCCLLAVPLDLLHHLYYTAQALLPRDGTALSRLGLPTPISIRKMPLQLQELKQKPWRNIAYCLSFHDLFILPFSYLPGPPARSRHPHSGVRPVRCAHSKHDGGIFSTELPIPSYF